MISVAFPPSAIIRSAARHTRDILDGGPPSVGRPGNRPLLPREPDGQLLRPHDENRETNTHDDRGPRRILVLNYRGCYDLEARATWFDSTTGDSSCPMLRGDVLLSCGQFAANSLKNQPMCPNMHQQQNPHFLRVLFRAKDLLDWLFLLLKLARLPVPSLRRKFSGPIFGATLEQSKDGSELVRATAAAT